MYSRFQLLKKYLHYYFTASNGKGHGVHSPFVFEFIQKVLPPESNTAFSKIESLRKNLLNDSSTITVEDFGAGSAVTKQGERKIKDIAASSLKTAKYASLLNRMISHYKIKTVLELGTSLGITTAYLSANPDVKVYTMEGADAIADIASFNFKKLSLQNIELVRGNFDDTLQPLLHKSDPGFIFIDGNHRHEPTIRYFKQMLTSANENTIMVFDDIYWSKEMEDAWKEIKNDDHVTLSIDLFFIGIIFFRKEFKVKQHFRIRF